MRWVFSSVAMFVFMAMPAFAAAPELPDDSRTPGVTNPDVTQDNIKETICYSGWTATVRPPVKTTNDLKKKQLAEWGYADKTMSHYEEDHRVPLEVGGSPDDPGNLWPEPYSIQWNARVKDKLETFIKRQVCAGDMTLEDGQNIFKGNWIDGFMQHCGSTPAAKCEAKP